MHHTVIQDHLVCPKCSGSMPRHAYPQADAYRCEQCHGLWLPMQAHVHLKDVAEQVDVREHPDPAMQQRDAEHCPSCGHHPLIDMVDVRQPHLHFESCTRCHGRYYDAGEFRDFAEDGFFEALKDFLAPLRE